MVHVSLRNPGMCENEMIVLFFFFLVIFPSDQLPPPTDLEFKWHEGFNVMLSWKKPSGLSDNVNYSYFFEKKTQNDAKLVVSVIGVCGLFEGGSWVPWFQWYQWWMNFTSRSKYFLIKKDLLGRFSLSSAFKQSLPSDLWAGWWKPHIYKRTDLTVR